MDKFEIAMLVLLGVVIGAGIAAPRSKKLKKQKKVLSNELCRLRRSRRGISKRSVEQQGRVSGRGKLRGATSVLPRTLKEGKRPLRV